MDLATRSVSVTLCLLGIVLAYENNKSTAKSFSPNKIVYFFCSADV